MRSGLAIAVAVQLVLAAAASGMIMDSAGNITDWGIRPFSMSNRADYENSGIWSTIQNNYAPLNYPSGVGYNPSPGGTLGEASDLEEMHVRVIGDVLQVLLVTSRPFSFEAVGTRWYLGDLFMWVGDEQFGVVTQSASQGLAAGSVYRIGGPSDVVTLQQAPGSYYGSTMLVANDYGPDATVPNIVGPWAVKGSIDPAKLLGTATLEWATFDYGGAENGTFILEYTLDTNILGLPTAGDATTKITWGCGNDVIRVRGGHVVPEPATLAFILIGATMMGLTTRRRTAQ